MKKFSKAADTVMSFLRQNGYHNVKTKDTITESTAFLVAVAECEKEGKNHRIIISVDNRDETICLKMYAKGLRAVIFPYYETMVSAEEMTEWVNDNIGYIL